MKIVSEKTQYPITDMVKTVTNIPNERKVLQYDSK